MGHQGDTISMDAHRKALAKEHKKYTKLIAEIEELAAIWRVNASRMVSGDMPQMNVLACVVGLMGLLSEKAKVQGDKLLSPCHQASIDSSRANGVPVIFWPLTTR